MKSIFFSLFLALFISHAVSQSNDCYEFNYEEGSLCPQCGEGFIEQDAYRGDGSTYSGECKDGVLNGKWKIQSDDIYGNIITNQTGAFINGKRTGKWITSEFPSYGDVLQVSEYGRIEVNYIEGVLEGFCKIYDRVHLKYIGQFKNGQRFGDWKLFDVKQDFDGDWSILKTPVVQIGVANHEVIGDSISKETIYHFEPNSNGKRNLINTAYYKGNLLHGAYTQFYKSGSISKVEIYKNGKLNGRSYSLKPDGDTINIIDYKNDLEYGLKRTFDENGKLIKQVYFIENPKNNYRKIKHGKFLESDISEINYDMNKKSGLYWGKTTKNDTLFLDSAYYKNDLLNGKWTTYYFDENTSSYHKLIERMCKDNKLHGKLKLFENNQLIKTENYIENQQEGEICSYNSNGQKSYCFFTSKGVKNGEYTQFANGFLIKKGGYINNQKEGYWFEYEGDIVVSITKYKNDITVEYYNKKGEIKKQLKKLAILSE